MAGKWQSTGGLDGGHRAGAPALKSAGRGFDLVSASFRHRGSSASAPARRVQRALGSVNSYRNCFHARAAGAAPVRAGDPDYGPHLDRDGDGVG